MQDPVVVVGLGRSGMGAARLLSARGSDVWLLDSGTDQNLQERASLLSGEGVQVELGQPLALSSFQALPHWPKRVVVSPGIPFDHPVLEQLRDAGWTNVRHEPLIQGRQGANSGQSIHQGVHLAFGDADVLSAE